MKGKKDMDVKLKLIDVLNINNILKEIIDNDKESKIDVVLKFKILGILKSLGTPLENIEVIRNEKIKKYGKEDDNGQISIAEDDQEARQKYSDDMNKVFQSEISLNIQKLKAEEVFKADIPVDYLVVLYPIIEE